MTGEAGKILEKLWGLQTSLFSPGSSSNCRESSKTTDILRQTKVVHGQVGVQVQCYQGQQYHCLQNIRYEAVREWSKRARLTPCCQLISPQSTPSGSSVPLFSKFQPSAAFFWHTLLPLASTFHNSEGYNNKSL